MTSPSREHPVHPLYSDRQTGEGDQDYTVCWTCGGVNEGCTCYDDEPYEPLEADNAQTGNHTHKPIP